MRTRIAISAVAAFFALMLAGMIVQGDTRALTPTSFGAIPAGYGALYDLLQESGLPVARSFAPPERLAPARAIWWIEPASLAVARDGERTPPSPAREVPLRGAAFARWIESGGTALVSFPGEPGSATTLAEREAPARMLAHPGAGDLDDEADSRPAPSALSLAGPLVGAAARTLELPAPLVFANVDAGAWRTVARLDGRPFVLEAALGRGRLVLVADSRFLSNAWLDRADAAPFALDLVRGYGVPWIDEHEHGFAGSQGTLPYLVRSPALPFFAGLALLALAFGWFGAALPARRVQEFDPSAPTLETFVASLARLYAATRDHGRVLDRYRELTARRLRRHLGIAPDATLAAVSDRLARRPGTSRAALALLGDAAPVRSEAELRRAVAALDALVAEVTT